MEEEKKIVNLKRFLNYKKRSFKEILDRCNGLKLKTEIESKKITRFVEGKKQIIKIPVVISTNKQRKSRNIFVPLDYSSIIVSDNVTVDGLDYKVNFVSTKLFAEKWENYPSKFDTENERVESKYMEVDSSEGLRTVGYEAVNVFIIEKNKNKRLIWSSKPSIKELDDVGNVPIVKGKFDFSKDKFHNLYKKYPNELVDFTDRKDEFDGIFKNSLNKPIREPPPICAYCGKRTDGSNLLCRTCLKKEKNNKIFNRIKKFFR